MSRPRPTRCPHDPEEKAEAYYLKHLNADKSLEFEQHIRECSSCAKIAADTLAFLRETREGIAEFLERQGQISPSADERDETD